MRETASGTPSGRGCGPLLNPKNKLVNNIEIQFLINIKWLWFRFRLGSSSNIFLIEMDFSLNHRNYLTTEKISASTGNLFIVLLHRLAGWLHGWLVGWLIKWMAI
jgi:hypothetical protein